MRKKSWLSFFLTLMMTSTSICYFSCEDQFSSNAEFIYINSTQDAIITVTPSVYNLKPLLPLASDTINIFSEASQNDLDEDNFVPPFIQAIVSYGEILCDTLQIGETYGTGEGILGIQNYRSERLGRNNFRFTYTFTEADVVKADTCQ